MSKRSAIVLFCCFAISFQSCKHEQAHVEKVTAINNTLTDLATKTDNAFFAKHLTSIQQVINAEKRITKMEASYLDRLNDAFLYDTLANPSDFQSYLNRERTLIISWTSPTDGKVSFAWLRLPKDWDADKSYPLYVHLHGHWHVAANPISFMSYTLVEAPSSTTAFEDGYFLSPWGRGNKWYHGISKTDVWESIAELEKMVNTDETRKYLCGHSMGGYGTWQIAQESDSLWAAIGIHSGALSFKDSKYLTAEYANKLQNTPTYFVWGDNEDPKLIRSNEIALKLLEESGNTNLKAVLFKGGHDYNEVDVENMYNWMRTFVKE